MLGILEDITKGEGKLEDIDLLMGLAKSIKAGSLCALGGTAPNPVLTTIRYFRDEYEEHITEKRCRALVCQSLISYYIDPDNCEGCMICHRNCPTEAIKGAKRMVHVIDSDKCIKCGVCAEVCPPKFAAVKKVSGEKMEIPSESTPVRTSKPEGKAATDE
jgi:NADH-quinone oxidoreductase subunit F